MLKESKQTERVREARATLLSTQPFFGVLSLNLRLVESAAVETMAVNSKTLIFNPAFVDSLSQAELKGVIAHEVFHLALGHHARQGARDAAKWNEAADYVINPLLLADGLVLPKGALIDKRFDGLTVERVYQMRADEQAEQQQPQPKPQPQPQQKAQGGNQGPPQPGQQGQPDASQQPAQGQPQGKPQPGAGAAATGHFDPAGAEGSAEAVESEREWRENANAALRAAQSAGKMPGGIKLEVQKAGQPKADWKALMRRFFNDQSRTRSTWARPNKRFPGQYLPGKVKDGMGCVAIIADTSGSIFQNARAVSRFVDESTAIFEEIAPARVMVVYCDSRVKHADTFEQGEPVVLKPVGGGGTLFQPAFDYLQREGIDPACCVYLTDLENGAERVSDPGYPVLWATYGAGSRVPPFGEAVTID